MGGLKLQKHRGSGSCSECCLFAVIGVFTRVGAIYSDRVHVGRGENKTQSQGVSEDWWRTGAI